MSPLCFTGIRKIQGEPYHIEMDTSMPLGKAPCTHRQPCIFQAAVSRNAGCRHCQASCQCHSMDQHPLAHMLGSFQPQTSNSQGTLLLLES